MHFSGRVHSIVFDDQAQGFYILRMVLDAEDSGNVLESKMSMAFPVTVRGHVPGLGIKIGTWFGFDAEWTTHPEYGKQLLIKKAPVFKGKWDADTVEQMLSGNGVGNRILKQLRQGAGNDDAFVKILDDSPAMEGILGDKFAAQYVARQWQFVRAYFQSVMFLNDLGLPPGRIKNVWTTFGDEAQKVLSVNPWALVRVEGITFEQADEIAARLGIALDNPERVKGAALYACRSNLNFGHLFLTATQIHADVESRVPGTDASAVATALADLHKAGLLVIDRSTRAGVMAVYDPKALEMEKGSADLLSVRVSKASFAAKGGTDPVPYIQALASVGPVTEAESKKKRPKLRKVVEAAVEDWGHSERLRLEGDQKEGVMNALLEPVSILTGLPGTGKTTSLRAVVRIFQESGIPFLLCAPTGIAAKNLASVTGARAYTIHRAFDARGGMSDGHRESTYAGIVGDSEMKAGGFDENGSWGYGSGNTHSAQVVIVDEASMLDQHLIWRLLTCTAENCRIVFVGDAAQLPSVGPGNVLRDLISCGKFPTVNLQKIFRQEGTSAIIYAAHSIFRGEVPDCQPPSDFSMVQMSGEERILSVIVRLAKKMYDARMNFQILSPRHQGPVGVTNLNVKLRELLNPSYPGLQEIRVGEEAVREDDRIMVVRNDYKLGVYNGDVGKVSKIDRRLKEVELKIFGDSPLYIRVPFKDVGQLIRLAYACTVHKCVSGDTLIHSADGLRRIDELAFSCPEGKVRKIKGRVAGKQGWSEMDQIFKGVVEPTIQVVTRSGYTLEGSYRHPVLVQTRTGKQVWKKLPDLKVGDVMVLRRGVGNLSSPVTTSGFKPDFGRKRLGHVPPVVDKSLAWVLGVLVGDGSQTDVVDGHVEFAQKDHRFRLKAASEFRRLFGVNPTIRSRSVYFHGLLIRDFLFWCGLKFDKSPTKTVPSVILRSPADVQGSFLRGLYDTDGGVNNLIHFTTVSPRLAFEVQQLLLGLGIISKRYKMRNAVPEKGWSAAYRVEITGAADKRLFQDFVGFYSVQKKRRLAALVAKTSLCKSNVGEIPGTKNLVKILRERLRKRGGRNYPEAKKIRTLLSNVVCGTAPLRVGHLSVLAEAIPDFERVSPELFRLWKDGLFFDPIILLSRGESQVFDLHVTDETHAFIGNGFVNHNSQGLEYDVIVMPLVSSFRQQLQRNLLYTAVTRAKKKVVLVGEAPALAAAVFNDKEDQRNTLFKDRLLGGKKIETVSVG